MYSITKQEEQPSFYLQQNKIKTLGRRKREIEELLTDIENNNSQIEYFEELLDNFTVEQLNQDQADKQLLILLENTNKLYLNSLFTGKFDSCDCVLSIHSGAGGEEAQDWVEMLMRMYQRYCNLNKFEFKITDILAGDGAGYKSVSFLISGINCYGKLKGEKGVHRLVRISPFDSNKRRHTSFASVDISPVIEDQNDIIVSAEDLKIDTYRSGGAGGQHVNKTESAVRITHIPTGIIVQCQNERSQLQNKEFALKMLKSKLLEKQEEERLQRVAEQKSEDRKIEWGSQIRSYILHPYNLVKDHRTSYETSDTTSVLNGKIEAFILRYLIYINRK